MGERNRGEAQSIGVLSARIIAKLTAAPATRAGDEAAVPGFGAGQAVREGGEHLGPPFRDTQSQQVALDLPGELARHELPGDANRAAERRCKSLLDAVEQRAIGHVEHQQAPEW